MNRRELPTEWHYSLSQLFKRLHHAHFEELDNVADTHVPLVDNGRECHDVECGSDMCDFEDLV